MQCVISRTGYTGEDGFELYHANADGVKLWHALVRPGGEVKPVGLGARDSLRLEMGYPLYGNDIDDETTPLEAGLGWIVKLKKPDFVGKAALEAQKARGLGRKLGDVRSGIVSPSTGDPIGTAYLPMLVAKPGKRFEVEIRGKRLRAQAVETPFWKKGSHR